MKKLLTIIALLFAFTAAPVAMAAPEAEPLSKSQTKAIEKDAKKRCKELKKAGWEPLASTTTLEYAMIKYRTYIESDEDNRVPITGIAIGRSNKIGRENAIHSGVASYAQRAKAQIIGKVKSVMSSDSHNVSQEEIDKFGAAYEAGVNTKMSGLVKEHFALVRTAKDGSKEFNVFMSIDEAKARKAREEAAREAKEKSHLGTLSEMVDEFIGEPVEADE